jgi:hypothetical protein
MSLRFQLIRSQHSYHGGNPVSRPPVATPPSGAPVTAPPARDLQFARADVIAACRRARVDGSLRESIAEELIVGLHAIAARPDATDREQLERALLGLIGGIVKGMVAPPDATSSTLSMAPSMTPPTGAQRLDPSVRENALRLLRELESMPEELRRPVTLHYLAGHNHRAIGKVLQIDETEAKLRVHHAVMVLRQRLGSEKRLIDLLPQLKYLRDTSGAHRISG